MKRTGSPPWNPMKKQNGSFRNHRNLSKGAERARAHHGLSDDSSYYLVLFNRAGYGRICRIHSFYFLNTAGSISLSRAPVLLQKDAKSLREKDPFYPFCTMALGSVYVCLQGSADSVGENALQMLVSSSICQVHVSQGFFSTRCWNVLKQQTFLSGLNLRRAQLDWTTRPANIQWICSLCSLQHWWPTDHEWD
jgi:hypothetical protein